jgi:hypothetical protein
MERIGCLHSLMPNDRSQSRAILEYIRSCGQIICFCSDAITSRVGSPERHAMPRPAAVWFQAAVAWLQRSIEEHAIDPIVVMEILDMPN